MKTKQILIGYRDKRIGLYKPKTNKLKLAGMLLFVSTCLVTPCTNWLIPVAAKTLNKLNPLWVYK